MKRFVLILAICLMVAVCLGAVHNRVVLPIETRKYLLTDYDAMSVSSAWEVDPNDNWMPVISSFNDPYFELDGDNNVMPTVFVFFTQDSNDDLMPLL